MTYNAKTIEQTIRGAARIRISEKKQAIVNIPAMLVIEMVDAVIMVELII
jgi:hypothetical protein